MVNTLAWSELVCEGPTGVGSYRFSCPSSYAAAFTPIGITDRGKKSSAEELSRAKEKVTIPRIPILNTRMMQMSPLECSYSPDSQRPGVFVQQPGTHSSPSNCFELAAQILAEHDLALPEPEQFALIARSALAVQCLYFAACLRHPDEIELHEVFEAFLLACVTHGQNEDQ